MGDGSKYKRQVYYDTGAYAFSFHDAHKEEVVKPKVKISDYIWLILASALAWILGVWVHS